MRREELAALGQKVVCLADDRLYWIGMIRRYLGTIYPLRQQIICRLDRFPVDLEGQTINVGFVQNKPWPIALTELGAIAVTVDGRFAEAIYPGDDIGHPITDDVIGWDGLKLAELYQRLVMGIGRVLDIEEFCWLVDTYNSRDGMMATPA